MAEHSNALEQQVETIIRASFAQQQGEEPDTTTSDNTGERQVIDVDLYRLEGGAVLLVPTPLIPTPLKASRRHQQNTRCR